MKFDNKIKTVIFFSVINFLGCLFAMEKPFSEDAYAPSSLEKQIFGRRIRIENQSGTRLLLKISSLGGPEWKTVLEPNASVDVGSLDNIPVKATYEPYGDVRGWLYAAYKGIITFDVVNRLEEVPGNSAVIIKIKKIGMFRSILWTHFNLT
jgi:hypothetical protein